MSACADWMAGVWVGVDRVKPGNCQLSLVGQYPEPSITDEPSLRCGGLEGLRGGRVVPPMTVM